jgi:hypothetical protein
MDGPPPPLYIRSATPAEVNEIARIDDVLDQEPVVPVTTMGRRITTRGKARPKFEPSLTEFGLASQRLGVSKKNSG